MRALHAAFLPLLVPAGCATGKPEAPVSKPPTAAAQPRTPQPAAKPAPPKPQPATGKDAAPVAKAPAAPALDLNTLEAQLKETKAIGFFTRSR